MNLLMLFLQDSKSPTKLKHIQTDDDNMTSAKGSPQKLRE